MSSVTLSSKAENALYVKSANASSWLIQDFLDDEKLKDEMPIQIKNCTITSTHTNGVGYNSYDCESTMTTLNVSTISGTKYGIYSQAICFDSYNHVSGDIACYSPTISYWINPKDCGGNVIAGTSVGMDVYNTNLYFYGTTAVTGKVGIRFNGICDIQGKSSVKSTTPSVDGCHAIEAYADANCLPVSLFISGSAQLQGYNCFNCDTRDSKDFAREDIVSTFSVTGGKLTATKRAAHCYGGSCNVSITEDASCSYGTGLLAYQGAGWLRFEYDKDEVSLLKYYYDPADESQTHPDTSLYYYYPTTSTN